MYLKSSKCTSTHQQFLINHSRKLKANLGVRNQSPPVQSKRVTSSTKRGKVEWVQKPWPPT